MSHLNSARIVRVSKETSGEEILKSLGIQPPPALIMIIGGAGNMAEDDLAKVTNLMTAGVAQAAAQLKAAVLDGGTQSGVMRLIGEALAKVGRVAPLIGVAPAGKVAHPAEPHTHDRVPLEPNHSHFVLVDGNDFGDETAVMYNLAQALSQKCPAIAVLINGGQIASEEVLWNVRQGREIVVFSGSGRLADTVTSAAFGQKGDDNKHVMEIIRRGKLSFFEITRPPEQLVELLTQKLERK